MSICNVFDNSFNNTKKIITPKYSKAFPSFIEFNGDSDVVLKYLISGWQQRANVARAPYDTPKTFRKFISVNNFVRKIIINVRCRRF